MTDCVEVRSLVDKLADFEATASEKLAAEAHLARCPSCRGHIEFLASLNAESRALSFPEPPESYWEHLPRKVLARIDSEDGRRGISRIPFAPPILRWGALGATLVLVTALGVTLLREEGPKAPAPAASAPTPAPATQALESEAPPPVAPIESPPMARDEAAPETARAEALAGARKSEPASEDSRETPAAPEEATVSMESNEVEVSSFRTAAPEPRENAPVLESADRARSAEVPATPGSAFEDFEYFRRPEINAAVVELAAIASRRPSLPCRP